MVHNPLSRLGRSDDGVVAIITVILTSVVFIALAALVVDLGMARDTRRQAQNAADASALAAGNVLYRADGTVDIAGATAAAKSFALANFGVPSTGWGAGPCSGATPLLVHDDTPCISFDSATKPTTVRVKVPIRAVSTPFAGIWGVSSVPVSAVAQVQFDNPQLAPCGLCVIGSGPHNLQVGNITVNGASVAINGTLVANNDNGMIKVTGTDVNGTPMGINLQGAVPVKGSYSPAPLANQAPIADPLASMAMPDYSTLTVHAITNACPGVPGIYDHLSACGGMASGLYVLTGVTGGNFGIVGNGVTLDLVCGTWSSPQFCATTGEVGGYLNFTGGGYLDITGPAVGQPNAGLAIVADRHNTATQTFGGNGAANTGTIYAASGTLAYNGNGALGTDSLIIVKDFSFAGSPSAFVSSYTQANNVIVPPSKLHLSQ